jgi:hypothetical protein
MPSQSLTEFTLLHMAPTCRAVTAVLCAAGNLKRAFPTAPEDVLMLRAINDGA